MNQTTALQQYTTAVENLKAHQEGNEVVFKEHARLLGLVLDARNQVEDAVAESGVGLENGMHRVTVTPMTQTIVDPDDLKAHAGQTLTPELIDQLVKTQNRPPRITINEMREVA
jgi:hypothetical protein